MHERRLVEFDERQRANKRAHNRGAIKRILFVTALDAVNVTPFHFKCTVFFFQLIDGFFQGFKGFARVITFYR